MISKAWRYSVTVTFDVDLTFPEKDPDHWDVVEAIKEAVENNKTDLQNYELNGSPDLVDAPPYEEP